MPPIRVESVHMWTWLIASVVLGAFGQIFMSITMKAAGAVPRHGALNDLVLYYIKAGFTLSMFGAVGCYGLSFILWLGVLSQKDLSLARPLMSLGYLITLAYGFYAGEQVTWERVLGTLLIIAGLFFIVRSGMFEKQLPTQSSVPAIESTAVRGEDR